MVVEIQTLEDFNKYVKESEGKLVVIDFTATWCGPCKLISPEFDALALLPENKNVIFLKVDVDEAEEVSEYCKIACMPTFHFYINGVKVEDFSGSDKNTLVQKINAFRPQ